jgi:hypothetical protein
MHWATSGDEKSDQRPMLLNFLRPLFTNLINKTMFGPGKHLKASLMFASKAGSYLSGAPLFALPKCISLDWKGLPGKNTLAYCKHFSIASVRSFIG